MVQSFGDGSATGIGSTRVNGMFGVLSAFFSLSTVSNGIMVYEAWDGTGGHGAGSIGLCWIGPVWRGRAWVGAWVSGAHGFLFNIRDGVWMSRERLGAGRSCHTCWTGSGVLRDACNPAMFGRGNVCNAML